MKTLIGIPCMAMVHTQFFQAVLGLDIKANPDNFIEFTMTETTLIYEARNRIAYRAIDGGFDRVLWLDSDMVFHRDLYARLSARLDQGYEYVSGLYFKRKGDPTPTIYKSLDIEEQEGTLKTSATYYEDYPDNELFEIAGSGLGVCMMSVDLLRAVNDEFGLPFSPVLGFGEDLSFCKRASELGRKMYCDSSIKAAHIANRLVTDADYVRYRDGQRT